MIYKHILPAPGQIPLGKLTQRDLQQFYTQMKTSRRLTRQELYGPGLSDRAIRGYHASYQAALGKATEDGLIAVNPADGCRLPPKRGREMQVLSREELQRLLIQAKAESCYELFLLDLSTGLRRGELLAYRTIVRSCQIFPSPKKEIRPGTRPSVGKSSAPSWSGPVAVTSGSMICATLSLRRLWSTAWTSKTLSAVIGHVSAATTLDTYTHVTNQMRAQAAGKIHRLMGGKPAVWCRKKQSAKTMTDIQARHPALAGNRLRHGSQQPPLGKTLLPQMAGREKASPQHLHPLPGGVRGDAGSYDPGGAGGDGCGKGKHGAPKVIENTRRDFPGGCAFMMQHN